MFELICKWFSGEHLIIDKLLKLINFFQIFIYIVGDKIMSLNMFLT